MRLLVITQKVNTADPILGFFHQWILQFALHTEAVEVIALEKGEYTLPGNVHVYSLGKERGASKLSEIATFFRLIFSLRKEYDAVFVHMNPEYLVLGGWFWKLGRKDVALWYTHKSKNLILRMGMYFADRIFTASYESFPIHNNKVRTVGHGIDLSRYDPASRQKKDMLHIMSVGRISQSKRIDLMLSVIETLRKDHVPVQLSLIGGPVTAVDTTYDQALKHEVREKKLPVQFLGPLPPHDVPKHLARADIFINLSETGGLDKAVLEAMAMEIPIVTTNKAFESTLENVSPAMSLSNTPSDIVKIIRTITSMSDVERTALGMSLRHIVEKDHSLSLLIPKILKYYRGYS